MSGCAKPPGPWCQEERPVWIDTGTTCIAATPSPAPYLDPFSSPAASRVRHATRYLEPEDVSYELADAPRVCVETSLAEISLAQMRVLAWLREHRAAIIAAEAKYHVDRRAIAGAIAWEALMNIRGDFTKTFGRGVGPGKAHLWDYTVRVIPFAGIVVLPHDDTLVKQVEDADWLPEEERLPRRSYEKRKELIETPEGAITYMAAAMNAASRLANDAGFPSIRQRPEVLTHFWQKKDLQTWKKHLASKLAGSDFGTGPDPAKDMDLWVARNLKFLEDAVGTPQFRDR